MYQDTGGCGHKYFLKQHYVKERFKSKDLNCNDEDQGEM